MITHVVVGYSTGLMRDLERLLPAGSVLLVEEQHVITTRGVREAAADLGCVAEVVAAPTQDECVPERVAAAVTRPERVRVVIPAVEYGVVAAAALAQAWGLPGAGVKAATTLRDKEALRLAAGVAGIAQPEWARVHDPCDVADARERFGGHCVLKPANRQASLGVQLLGPDDDVVAAWAHTTAAAEPRIWATYPDRARFLAEQRVAGPEVSVEALVADGVIGFRNVTAKSVQDSRYPVETGHVVPADLPQPVVADLDAAIAALVAATDYRTGVLHAEWILVEGRPHLVECAGRVPGDDIDVLVDLAYGGSLVANFVTVLEGRGAAPQRAATGASAIRFLPVRPGVVTAVSGLDRARACPGVWEVDLDLAPGTTVGAVTNSWQRAGHVIAIGADPAEAVANADRAVACVAIATSES